jgi:hypothetical protein
VLGGYANSVSKHGSGVKSPHLELPARVPASSGGILYGVLCGWRRAANQVRASAQAGERAGPTLLTEAR